MTDAAIVLPSVVREKAAQVGEAGLAWLVALPDLVRALERRWSVTVGSQLEGGTSAFVARARMADGTAAVLKISVPDGAMAREIRTVEAADGHGYVRVLASDVASNALLLERLGPPLNRCGLSPEAQIDTLCTMLRLAWQVAPATGDAAETAYDKARSLAQLTTHLWESMGRPCSERVVDRALAYSERRSAAFDPERCVVVHGDPGQGNALRVLTPRAGAEAGFVFVDPDGFVGDPSYDLGVVLREWCPELLAGDPLAVAQRYCRLLAAGSGMAEAAIWEWGFMERVSTGLYLLSLGAEELGRPFLTTAETLVRRGLSAV